MIHVSLIYKIAAAVFKIYLKAIQAYSELDFYKKLVKSN